MKIPQIGITKNALWTIGAFSLLQAVRLSTNLILTRLLTPELFRILVIVNSLTTGVGAFEYVRWNLGFGLSFEDQSISQTDIQPGQ
jgi:hypothetical protein